MMTVHFSLEAQLRTITGQGRLTMELPDATTLADAVCALSEHLGEPASRHLVNPTGMLRPSLLMLVDGESVYSDEAGALSLRDGCEVLLMPPIAGG